MITIKSDVKENQIWTEVKRAFIQKKYFNNRRGTL